MSNNCNSVPEIDFNELVQFAGNKAQEFIGDCGCLLIRNIFPENLVKEWQLSASDVLAPKLSGSSLEVGDKRKMHTLRFQKPWNNPILYENPALLELLRRCLGLNVCLGSMTLVNSVPGATAQHVHRDHSSLFPDGAGGVDLTPAYAITVLIPLVEQNEISGNTRVWIGSHRDLSIVDSSEVQGVDYTAKIGDCLLMDYRLLHGGLGNRSTSNRPLLSLVYTRPWFQDRRNFRIQSPLKLSRKAYREASEDTRILLKQHIGMAANFDGLERMRRRLRIRLSTARQRS